MAAQVPLPSSATLEVDTTGLLIKPPYDADALVASNTFHCFGGKDQYPTFKGGQKGLGEFLRRNSKWPDSLSRTAAGQVFVDFIIDELGRVRNARVVRSFHPLASAEALRLVQLLDGYFTPGKYDGRPMAVKLTLPISFGSKGDE